MNDIGEAVTNLNVTVELFADDTKMLNELDFASSRELKTACSRIASCAENWQMQIALNKGIALCITNKKLRYYLAYNKQNEVRNFT
jgi:hypothetical protein